MSIYINVLRGRFRFSYVRFTVVVWSVFFAISTARAEPGITPGEILIGQSTSLTGPLAELGKDAAAASHAYFKYINDKGGVNGRKIRLLTLDDGYDTEKAVANVQKLISIDQVFALFNVLGTPTNVAILPIITREKIPDFAPYTGSDAIRLPFNRYVFNVRAAYRDETEKIVEHLIMRGIGKIAVVYQNNSFGKDGLNGLEAALARHKLQLHARITIESDASDANQAATALLQSHPQAIVLVTAGKPSAQFIEAYNALAVGMQFVSLSVMGTQTSVASLGKGGSGVIVSQVMPFPFSATTTLVREYQRVMTDAGISQRSFASMEGFLNAKVMVEALTRAGRKLSREGLIDALESMHNVDVGGYQVNFSDADHQGSHFVDLTVISRFGGFLR